MVKTPEAAEPKETKVYDTITGMKLLEEGRVETDTPRFLAFVRFIVLKEEHIDNNSA